MLKKITAYFLIRSIVKLEISQLKISFALNTGQVILFNGYGL